MRMQSDDGVRMEDTLDKEMLDRGTETSKPSALAVQIGARIRQARTAQMLMPDVLAAKLNFSSKHLKLLEEGQVQVQPGELLDLSQRLRRPISYFFFDEPEADLIGAAAAACTVRAA